MTTNTTSPSAPNYQASPSDLIALLRALDAGASMAVLLEATGKSKPVVDRLLRSLREDWGCVIEYDRAGKQYRMTGSGMFDLG